MRAPNARNAALNRLCVFAQSSGTSARGANLSAALKPDTASAMTDMSSAASPSASRTSARAMACRQGSSPLIFLRASLRRLLRRQQGLTDQRHADIASKMQQRFDEFILGPALVARHAQMQLQFGVAPVGGIGNNADQRAGFQVQAGTRPKARRKSSPA